MKIKLKYVHYMPKLLEPNTLYVSKEFNTAAHLCACGCGAKIRTPLKATEWNLKDEHNGPTLYPSIGNWQLPCKSHYWIYQGEIRWAEQWSPEQITAGRKAENERRRVYYDSAQNQNSGIFQQIWNWIISLF